MLYCGGHFSCLHGNLRLAVLFFGTNLFQYRRSGLFDRLRGVCLACKTQAQTYRGKKSSVAIRNFTYRDFCHSGGRNGVHDSLFVGKVFSMRRLSAEVFSAGVLFLYLQYRGSKKRLAKRQRRIRVFIRPERIGRAVAWTEAASPRPFPFAK